MQSESKSSTRRARLGRHIRHNLVGYVALGVAVSMTPLPAQAAAALVGTGGIKNGAITTPKLAAAAVKAPKIAAAAVTAPKIATGAVNTAKIADGTIQKVDIAAAAQGYTSIVTERVTVDNIINGAQSARNVQCPGASIAVGGGAYVETGDGENPGGEVHLSTPMNQIFVFPSGFETVPAGDGVPADFWRTEIQNNTGSTRTAVHYAICATK